MAGGRPPEYNKEIVKKVKQYLKGCEDKTKRLIGHTNSGNKYRLYGTKFIVKIPTIEGLALFLHIHKDTIYEWEKSYPEFSDVIGDLRSKQADRLINNGLSGEYNSTIAKVLLTKHGYRDATEIMGKDGKDLIPDKQSKERADEALNSFLNNGKDKGNTKQGES